MAMIKKLISVVSSAIIISNVVAVNASALNYVGNVNHDSFIDATDASEILEYYSKASTGEITEVDEFYLERADIDENNIVDAVDASCVLSYYSYLSTLSENETPLEIRDYIKYGDYISVNIAASPEAYKGEAGTLKYTVNTTEQNPHYEYPLYNIKENNDHDGEPYLVRTYKVRDRDILILKKFAAEHFTDDMSNYDRIEYTLNWLHDNVVYADGSEEWNTYDEIVYNTFVEACFEKKLGQCIQYNGALAAMLAYLGYDVYMLEMWNGANNTIQHFRAEVKIDDVYYSLEVGNTNQDSGNYKWKWMFDESKARFHGLPEEE